MRLMLVLMGNAESFEMARPLLRTLTGAGVEVTLVHYSSEDVVPVDDLIATGTRYLPLSDDGFGSIPRLSRRQYQRLCGDDIDFLGVQYHNVAREGFAPRRDYLFADSMFHQWFHGFAYRAEVLLRECRPDVVVVNHGSEPISKIVHAKAAKLGLPALLMESSFVPGRLLLDPVGMHFFPGQNRVDREWPRVRETPLRPDEQARLDSYLREWRTRAVSKYAQPESPREVGLLEGFGAPGRKRLFVVDQVPFDANIINGLRGFETFDEMVGVARRSLPDGWDAVYKLHPRNPAVAEVPVGVEEGRFLTLRDVSIHRILGRCDAVLTYSSNVGLEALAYDKAVLVAGRPHYGGRGLTLDVESPDGFPEAVRRSQEFRPDPTLRDRFLSHVLFDYLVDAQDAPAILRRIEEARQATRTSSRCPFDAHYHPRFAALRGHADAYNAHAGENLDHEEIVRRLGLGGDEGGPGWSRLDSGERQVAIDYAGVAENHLVRYRLARELVRPGMDVLDLSCGIGYGSALLAEGTGARRVVGVDCSESAIAFAREFWSAPRVTYVRSSAGAFPLEPGSFDLIVSFETVEHLANDREFVGRSWAALRPGGLLLLSAPNQNGYAIRRHEFHVQHYTAEGLTALLGGRPDLAGSVVLGQVGETRIEGRPGGKHLIAVAQRGPLGPGTPPLEARLGPLLPFTRAMPEDPGRSPIRLRAHRFRTEAGRLAGDRVVVGGDVENRHAVSGPYYRLATGRHAAGFLLRVDGEATPGTDARLILDVADGEGRALARLDLREPQLRALAGPPRRVVLPFRHEDRSAVLQFRVYVEGRPIHGNLEFFGVELRSTAMRDEGLDADGGVGDPFEDASEALDLLAAERERLDGVLAELGRVRDEFERFREHIEHAKNDWTALYREADRRLRVTEEERDYLSWERGEIARDRDDLRQQLQAAAREREEWARTLEALRAERDASVGRLREVEGRLRPYVLVDRAGVVPRSLGLASRLKQRLRG
jgi:hypothetical protein